MAEVKFTAFADKLIDDLKEKEINSRLLNISQDNIDFVGQIETQDDPNLSFIPLDHLYGCKIDSNEKSDFMKGERIVSYSSVKEFALSILSNGYDSTESVIYVKKVEDNQYNVLSGNHRIAAINLLREWEKDPKREKHHNLIKKCLSKFNYAGNAINTGKYHVRCCIVANIDAAKEEQFIRYQNAKQAVTTSIFSHSEYLNTIYYVVKEMGTIEATFTYETVRKQSYPNRNNTPLIKNYVEPGIILTGVNKVLKKNNFSNRQLMEKSAFRIYKNIFDKLVAYDIFEWMQKTIKMQNYKREVYITLTAVMHRIYKTTRRRGEYQFNVLLRENITSVAKLFFAISDFTEHQTNDMGQKRYYNII